MIVSPLLPFHFERKIVLLELGRWGGHHPGGKKTIHFLMWFWLRNRQRQSRNGTSPIISPRLPTPWGCEKSLHRLIFHYFPPMAAPTPPPPPLPPTTRNLFYSICVRFAQDATFFLWLIRPISGISVSTLCHRLVYQYDGSLPWFLRRFQPKARLIHSPTNVFN